ncbi:hypothetical protein A2334_01970 [Candidatus Roizmanbacteria bacterium RIFOXYB2_FULL_38_10]|uniref:Aminotransferase class I/classII large domain-containing protein n=1 Tax=Candidatus Roizmanbacteria bacterium RIFOXYD1_FULL_38_12 TaxID=1802093 RepID=A0A1F7L1Z2_9BACT|nr:MAG: hypothetical protein A3K47_05390 [Candidatus Roizmanbacteria bacterium RIFOXYA2_FULL_38_14]OGK64179.1 MAG: hypothetical protein A3K27_05390 [Candidatus Roizmanbacteria bacterium RIFOXYA1_FULL_37_12]OGK66025.1 MAG: hypothetical protein A3K38_05390 [Candidatus Roizmanbacteria bacterium RIFOXYB1_FULL_40_23]OGK67781.1 MAG: hypothetical protein A2334_01970 [Candidatus Roizmanbacteria bacterium RIFOXYB2_FULL_38_10]OGK70429.1 MAG: hypothetical protein A3K21_05395 [Candidatus Roizmanbacteria ba
MKRNLFHSVLQKEIERIDHSHTAKRGEKIIEGFTDDPSPRAIIKKKRYLIFNSNDYLGLRFESALRKGEENASQTFGTGPGAVRFISGTFKVYKDLEKALATFHKREDAMIFSSAFAANLAVLFCMIKGQSKDSLVSGDTLVVSDSLNHRSIIDGIRIANLPKEQRLIYKHLDYANLKEIIVSNTARYKRVLIVTDGIFSMLGEYVNLDKIRKIIETHESKYEEGVHLVVDDSHGVASLGANGQGVEEVTRAKADILVGTMGKGFGADGGYVVADKIVIDYLRESAASYIYSNSISPGVAGAALSAVNLVKSSKGKKLLRKSKDNIKLFKQLMKKAGFQFAADSIHPIQPVWIGDTKKTKALTEDLFKEGILVTNINYPVVPQGKDEIRVQISASHEVKDIEYFVKVITKSGKKLAII